MSVEIEQMEDEGDPQWIVSDDYGNEEVFDDFDEAVAWAEDQEEYNKGEMQFEDEDYDDD